MKNDLKEYFNIQQKMLAKDKYEDYLLRKSVTGEKEWRQ
tara:strand:- start:1054 stop:1170 length:117 start_codon:yes stop_codon:yes gene_type:complete